MLGSAGRDESEPAFRGDEPDGADGGASAGPPQPVNWNLLTADEAEIHWIELNKWVNWLRRTYGLPASVVPPFWHRHPELVWELSALHLHWLCAYDPDQHASAPLGWHHDFADARQRLHDWVSRCGTRLDKDRPTRQTLWPGEDAGDAIEDVVITNRDEDFVAFVLHDLHSRDEAERLFYSTMSDGGA
ncbi:hypothetical protein [Microbacterium pumilum]|uniref:DUF4913 domain-containing protein n=1 Tax=Microbacterium pumilum TaxID=344165 RepID=A0ABN2T1B7_9MICO